jgi:hypothetical protein
MPTISRITEHADGAIAAVIPGGIIEKRIPADALNRHTSLKPHKHFFENVTQPGQALVILRSGFGNEHLPLIALMNSLSKRPTGGKAPVRESFRSAPAQLIHEFLPAATRSAMTLPAIPAPTIR